MQLEMIPSYQQEKWRLLNQTRPLLLPWMGEASVASLLQVLLPQKLDPLHLPTPPGR
jgi:hypothetical protein